MMRITCAGCGENIVSTSQVEPSHIICPKCGKSLASIREAEQERTQPGTKRCAYCGSIILEESSVCSECGYSQPENDVLETSVSRTTVTEKKKLSFGMGILCFIVPFLGVALWSKDKEKDPRKATLEILLSIYPTLVCIIVIINGASAGAQNYSTDSGGYRSAHAQTATDVWYEGGTLHQANGLEWQQATYQNKLATCGDIVCMMWQEGHLRSDLAATIHEIDDIRPLADSLVRALNTAFEPYPDPEQNERAYTNQTVADFAAMILGASGWWQ